jgi:hypothetical protein
MFALAFAVGVSGTPDQGHESVGFSVAEKHGFVYPCFKIFLFLISYNFYPSFAKNCP